MNHVQSLRSRIQKMEQAVGGKSLHTGRRFMLLTLHILRLRSLFIPKAQPRLRTEGIVDSGL